MKLQPDYIRLEGARQELASKLFDWRTKNQLSRSEAAAAVSGWLFRMLEKRARPKKDLDTPTTPP